MHSTPQALRRPLLILSALAASVAAFAIGSGNASAHHANIMVATVACSGEVAFTTSAWEGQGEGEELILSRTNPSVAVTYRVNGAGAEIPVTTGAFTQANGFQFGGQFMWPGSNPASITIYSTPQAPWGNGSPGGGSDAATIVRPTGCENPSAAVASTCTATGGTVTVTLENDDIFSSIDFSVANPLTGAVQVVSVPAGATSTVTFTGLPDGTHPVTILAGGENLSSSVVVECDEPAATTSTTAVPTTSTTAGPSTTTGPTSSVAALGPVPTPAPGPTSAAAGPTPTAVAGSLPATGSSTMNGLLIGTMLVALGGLAAFAARRRRPA